VASVLLDSTQAYRVKYVEYVKYLFRGWDQFLGEEFRCAVVGVIEVAERTEGVRLGELLDTLQPDSRIIGEVLAEILRDAATGDKSGD
jgi:hypothetical protein